MSTLMPPFLLITSTLAFLRPLSRAHSEPPESTIPSPSSIPPHSLVNVASGLTNHSLAILAIPSTGAPVVVLYFWGFPEDSPVRAIFAALVNCTGMVNKVSLRHGSTKCVDQIGFWSVARRLTAFSAGREGLLGRELCKDAGSSVIGG